MVVCSSPRLSTTRTAASSTPAPRSRGQLDQALAGLTCTSAKQRSVVLADLATAHGSDGDWAADYLNQAVDALYTDWYGTGLDRVRAVRPVLGDSRHGAQLDEGVAALTASRAALPGG
ncbi:hypothetical protein [Plantactinospora alkalitolerans]|uniref:hypothetical protein n=1 Tax=Plantactinospora alkalitolerans TaxID=2789879 RepID=UPI001E65982B|nr:hypothetical protein [Plantactinospora alkalitolerans]